MISTIVIFVLAFAALGLLLGYAEVFDVQQEQERVTINESGSNSTSLTFEEEISVQVESG